jgi:hypothetical protein
MGSREKQPLIKREPLPLAYRSPRLREFLYTGRKSHISVVLITRQTEIFQITFLTACLTTPKKNSQNMSTHLPDNYKMNRAKYRKRLGC